MALFLFMVAELSALQQIIYALTGLDGLPALVIEAAITAIYTCKLAFEVVANMVNQLSSRRFSYLLHHRQYPGGHGGWTCCPGGHHYWR